MKKNKTIRKRNQKKKMNKNNVLTSLGCVNYSKDVNFMSASLEKNIGLLIAKF